MEKELSSTKSAHAKQILWSPWGKLPPRGGGGLPQGGDDDEDEQIVRIVIQCKSKVKAKAKTVCKN